MAAEILVVRVETAPDEDSIIYNARRAIAALAQDGKSYRGIRMQIGGSAARSVAADRAAAKMQFVRIKGKKDGNWYHKSYDFMGIPCIITIDPYSCGKEGAHIERFLGAKNVIRARFAELPLQDHSALNHEASLCIDTDLLREQLTYKGLGFGNKSSSPFSCTTLEVEAEDSAPSRLYKIPVAIRYIADDARPSVSYGKYLTILSVPSYRAGKSTTSSLLSGCGIVDASSYKSQESPIRIKIHVDMRQQQQQPIKSSCEDEEENFESSFIRACKEHIRRTYPDFRDDSVRDLTFMNEGRTHAKRFIETDLDGARALTSGQTKKFFDEHDWVISSSSNEIQQKVPAHTSHLKNEEGVPVSHDAPFHERHKHVRINSTLSMAKAYSSVKAIHDLMKKESDDNVEWHAPWSVVVVDTERSPRHDHDKGSHQLDNSLLLLKGCGNICSQISTRFCSDVLGINESDLQFKMQQYIRSKLPTGSSSGEIMYSKYVQDTSKEKRIMPDSEDVNDDEKYSLTDTVGAPLGGKNIESLMQDFNSCSFYDMHNFATVNA